MDTTPIKSPIGVLPNLKPKSLSFFDHELGDTQWENFVLATMVIAATFTVAEALYQIIPIIFKKILKIHESYHELLAIISLLVVTQEISVQQAKSLLEEYGAGES